MASRPDNIKIDSEDDEDFPLPKKADTPRPVEIKVNHENGACWTLGCLCDESKKKQAEDSKRAPLQSNFQLIESLTKNLISYIESEKITGLDSLIAQLQAAHPSLKIAFVKMYLCPRVHGLRNHIKEQLTAAKVAATAEQIDKCARFLEAMCEVAEQ
jgi:hypothetical protein